MGDLDHTYCSRCNTATNAPERHNPERCADILRLKLDEYSKYCEQWRDKYAELKQERNSFEGSFNAATAQIKILHTDLEAWKRAVLQDHGNWSKEILENVKLKNEIDNLNQQLAKQVFDACDKYEALEAKLKEEKYFSGSLHNYDGDAERLLRETVLENQKLKALALSQEISKRSGQ